MKLRAEEVEFLSAWASEEKAPDPYILPCHQLQAVHQVSGVVLIRMIKTWARTEGRKDEDIFHPVSNAIPPWPWSSAEDFRERAEEIGADPHGAADKAVSART
jgi:hypothetical protein